ncbi:MAG: hypothetical protein WB626_07500 [Bacteroidota bacterium]
MRARAVISVGLLPLLLCLYAPRGIAGRVASVGIAVAPVNTLTLNDLDFVNATTPKWLFTISLIAEPPGPAEVQQMIVSFTAVLSGGEDFGEVARLRTKPFTVEGVRHISNLDLRRGSPLLLDFELIEPQAQRLRDIALPSGVVPAGVYDIRITVVDAEGNITTLPDGPDFIITNPSALELLSPPDGEPSAGLYPLFQWRGDAPRWRISLFRRLPGQTGNEETASGMPILSEEMAAPVFSYPASGAAALEPGSSYVWFVEGLVGASGGAGRVMRSEIRSFSTGGGVGARSSTLLDELERALGSRYQVLVDQLRAEAMTESGALYLNGSPVTLSELMQILGGLRADPESVTGVEIE